MPEPVIPPWCLAERARLRAAVEENGLMLGAFSFASYTEVELPFHEGMRALLYTDGILEMSNAAGEEFGIDRLTGFTLKHEHDTRLEFCRGALSTALAMGRPPFGPGPGRRPHSTDHQVSGLGSN